MSKVCESHGTYHSGHPRCPSCVEAEPELSSVLDIAAIKRCLQDTSSGFQYRRHVKGEPQARTAKQEIVALVEEVERLRAAALDAAPSSTDQDRLDDEPPYSCARCNCEAYKPALPAPPRADALEAPRDEAVPRPPDPHCETCGHSYGLGNAVLLMVSEPGRFCSKHCAAAALDAAPQR